MLQEDLASPSGLADAVEAESTDLLSPDMNEVPSASEVDVRPEGHNSPPVPSAASPVADSFDADGLQESVIEARAPDATDTHPAEADDARHDSGSPPEPAADAEGSQNHDYQRSPAEFSPAKHTGLGGRQAPECPVPVSYDYDPNYWVCLDAPQSYLSSLPPGSRLFIGNLASEHTDKIQMAHVFAKYGNIAEISLKESYGFVQFDNPEACRRAISAEQGRVIAGMMIDLKSSREKYPGRKNDDFAGFAGRKFDRGADSGICIFAEETH